MDIKLINVGIADYKISSAPNILRTILGSCIGICIYDPKNKIGVLSHIMLAVKKNDSSSEKKYADSAIPLIIEEMEKEGADPKNFTAKIIGGARMFKLSENSIMGEIGENNISKVKEVLGEYGIKILSEDIGKDYGRTIDFYLDTGEIKVKSIGKEMIIL